MTTPTEKPVTQGQLRRYRNGAVAGFFVLLLGIGAQNYISNKDTSQVSDQGRSAIVHSGRYVGVESCNRDFRFDEELRALIRQAGASTDKREASGTLSHQDAADERRQTAKALEKIALPDCRSVANAITDNPENIKPSPKPLYPGVRG